jgi:hypothetical protein
LDLDSAERRGDRARPRESDPRSAERGRHSDQLAVRERNAAACRMCAVEQRGELDDLGDEVGV